MCKFISILTLSTLIICVVNSCGNIFVEEIVIDDSVNVDGLIQIDFTQYSNKYYFYLGSDPNKDNNVPIYGYFGNNGELAKISVDYYTGLNHEQYKSITFELSTYSDNIWYGIYWGGFNGYIVNTEETQNQQTRYIINNDLFNGNNLEYFQTGSFDYSSIYIKGKLEDFCSDNAFTYIDNQCSTYEFIDGNNCLNDEFCINCNENSGKCYQCMEGYYFSQLNGIHYNCQSCEDTIPNCEECKNYDSINQCDTCKDGYIKSYDWQICHHDVCVLS